MSAITKQLSFHFPGRRTPPSSTSIIRLVLLGKTGCGKSSTANSILGRKVLDVKVSSASATQKCRRVSGEFRGQKLLLLDTTGVLDAHQTPQELQRELRKSVSLLFPGPHAFIIVVQIGRFTQDEREAVVQIQRAMGPEALSFSVVVFTHADRLEEGVSVKQCLLDECEDLADLVSRCGGRYCVFDNQNFKNREQVSELLALVEGMMQENRESYYTSKMLQRAEQDLAQKQLLHKEQDEGVEEWYERKLELIQQQSRIKLEEMKKNQEIEKEKERELEKSRKEVFRREMEERKSQEVMRLMERERRKREALQEKLDKVTKMLEEQVEREDKLRRSMEEKIQKQKEESERKERERELQLIQMERTVRQREETERDALQKDFEKLIRSLEELSRKEEEKKKQMENRLRCEREENQREMEMLMKQQRAEKQQSEALKMELKLVKNKAEQQRASQESLRTLLENILQKENNKYNQDISTLKNLCREKCVELIGKVSTERPRLVTNITAYAHQMGLMGLNMALEKVGTQCCIQ